MAKAKKLFTIGYEQTPPKSVLDELEQAGVKLLVDVRAVASSRRPGFSKNQLAAGLDERGIAYLASARAGHAEERPRSRAQRRIRHATQNLREAPQDDAGQRRTRRAVGAGQKSGPVCILCYERDHLHCHRQWIAEIIRDRDGVKVENLVAPQV